MDSKKPLKNETLKNAIIKAAQLGMSLEDISQLLIMDLDILKQKIWDLFGCSPDAWIQSAHKHLDLKIRENQLLLSENSSQMAIFLGKNRLNQQETPKVSYVDPVLTDFLKNLREGLPEK